MPLPRMFVCAPVPLYNANGVSIVAFYISRTCIVVFGRPTQSWQQQMRAFIDSHDDWGRSHELTDISRGHQRLLLLRQPESPPTWLHIQPNKQPLLIQTNQRESL